MTRPPAAASAPGRDQALDGLRGLASLALFNLAFLSGFVEVGFYVPDTAGPLGRLAAKALLVGVYTGVPAMDLLFVLSGYFLYKALLERQRGPLHLLWRRYKRFWPLYLIVSVPAFVYGGARLPAIAGHLALLAPYDCGSFVYQIASKANYYLYFAFVCAALAACGRRLPACPATPAVLGAACAAAISLAGASERLNFHFLGFFYGAFVAALLADRDRPLAAWLRRPPTRIALLALLAAASWYVWHSRVDEFIPLLARIDARTFVRATAFHLLGGLLVLSLAGAAAGPPGRLLRPCRLLGRASLSFFLAWSLYGFVLGRSVHAFPRPTTWTMLFLYAATLGASLVLTWFFSRYFEGGSSRNTARPVTKNGAGRGTTARNVSLQPQ